MNIVFDFGAVLFTWQPVHLLQTHLGHLAPTAEAAHSLARAIFDHDDWLGYDRGTHALDDVLQRTALRLDLPHDRLDAMLSPIGERMAPIAATVELLAGLRERRETRGDVRLYFLSNMPAPYARVLEERHPFIGWFDGGIFSGDVNLIKPEPAIYSLLAARHGLEPARTVFIDDMHANVQAARELGWQGIHFESPPQLSHALASLLPD
ncbi:MAG: HAD family phosphatase [Pseudomonadota bacterium]